MAGGRVPGLRPHGTGSLSLAARHHGAAIGENDGLAEHRLAPWPPPRDATRLGDAHDRDGIALIAVQALIGGSVLADIERAMCPSPSR